MLNPQVIFGCASIGAQFTTKEDVLELSKALQAAGVTRLDTAARYPPTSPGLSQKLLGEARVGQLGFSIDTKIWCTADTNGSLTEEAIGKSLKDSLLSLDIPKINVIYCHAPDNRTPIAEQAAAFNKYYQEGKFNQLGLSNFTPEMIKEWMAISNKKGYVKPTVYQGQYNLFCRGVETTLFPVLRKHAIHFTAFSPLAGGFLTGKFTSSIRVDELKGTRWEVKDDNPYGKAFRHWYDHPGMHSGVEKLRAVCDEYSIPMEEASLRWIVFHSALQAGDGVILGASRVSQISSNTEQITHGSLPEPMVQRMGDWWDVVKGDARQV